MIVVDSSAWIEYYRPAGDTSISDLVEDAIRRDVAAINGIITVEVAGFANERERVLIEEDFSGLHIMELTDETVKKAVSICSELRKNGTTIPATDAIIGASALLADASLIHLDGHFEQIAENFPLRTMTAKR